MRVIRLELGPDLVKVQCTVSFKFDRLGLNATQYRCAAALVFIGVRLLAYDVFVAALAVRQ